MFKLALNAGHGKNTLGKRCLKKLDKNQTREWILNSRICEKIEEKLKAYTGYDVLRLDNPTGKKDIALKTRTNNANNFGADFYLSIHHNAGVNGGTGGGEWKFASGTVTSTGSAMTIRHELGAVPDIIFVHMKRQSEDKNFFLASLQFSNAMIEAFNGAGEDNEKGLGFAMLENLGLATLTMREGVDGAHTQFGEMYGQIRKADAVSFTVGGGTITSIPSDREVTWWAVSGIT